MIIIMIIITRKRIYKNIIDMIDNRILKVKAIIIL